MIKIKVFCGASGLFNVWAHVTHDGGLYRVIFQDDTDGMSGYYFVNRYRQFVAA